MFPDATFVATPPAYTPAPTPRNWPAVRSAVSPVTSSTSRSASAEVMPVAADETKTVIIVMRDAMRPPKKFTTARAENRRF